jgi:hypothetical protein
MDGPKATEQFDILMHKQYKQRKYSRLIKTKTIWQKHIYEAQAKWGNKTPFDFLIDVEVPIPLPAGVAEGSKLFLSISATDDGCVGFFTAPVVEKDAGRFLRWGIYPYLHHAVTTHVQEECKQLNAEAAEKNLNGDDAKILNDLTIEALVDDPVAALQRLFSHAPIAIATFEDFRWDPTRNTVTDVDSMNMGRVVVDYGEGLADMHIDPDDEEDSTVSAEPGKDTGPAAEDDEVTVITNNTSIGPTVFNMSDKNKDDPSIDEEGRLRQKPQ